MDEYFYVKNRRGDLVPAKFMSYNGSYIQDPNTLKATSTPIYDVNGKEIASANPNSYLIVPQLYSINNAIAFAQQVSAAIAANPVSGSFAAAEMMISAYVPGGNQDLQRFYSGSPVATDPGGAFVAAFTDSASFSLGVVSSYAGYPISAPLVGAMLST